MIAKFRLRRKLREFAASAFGKQNVSRLLKSAAYSSRKLASFLHKTQLNFDWTVAPSPEWHDHYGDQFYNFRASRIPFWTERGVFGLLAVKEGARILELCCGDGFNAYHFYSGRAASMLSVDFDKDAILHAKRYNQADNIEFLLADIRTEMPEGVFDNIIWDAAIEHFTEEEIDAILANIKTRLVADGIITGVYACGST